MLSDGYNVKYVPIDYYHRAGDSKISPIKDTVRFTQLVVRTVMYFNPLRVFVPISLTLFVASFLVLLYRLFSGEGLLVLGIILLRVGDSGAHHWDARRPYRQNQRKA